jgi:tRNA threonylcarbamoyl adenosine modification protein YeaZ
MSKVLAIDTSTARTSVAIIDGDTVLFTGYKDGATAHGPSLPALVQEALMVSEVNEVVVGMGPGPFTGLRVGIAFAQSFALGQTNTFTRRLFFRCDRSTS